jgi:serine phosphatase RsbU (regulator of sigma subunit)
MRHSLLEWGVATLALPGQSESGDRHVVRDFPGGALVAVVDGLGHGEEAAAAAQAAASTLEDHAREPLSALVNRCHERLRGTRGAVMSLAAFDRKKATLSWVGIGNVEGVLLRDDPRAVPQRESLLLRGGVVGHQVPSLHVSNMPVARGDLLIFATDGVHGGLDRRPARGETPQQVADRILRQHGKGLDDALVVAARYLGEGG